MSAAVKKEIRRRMLTARQNLSAEEARARSLRVVENIRKSALYRAARTVCLYVPICGEVDVRALFGEKEVYLPRIREGNMEFCRYEGDARLAPGAYGIPEPTSQTVLTPNEQTLVILPGAAFTPRGDRIGYGGGYYDRYLSRYPKVRTMAAAYDFQITESLPTDPHDVRVEAVAGENEICICN